MSLLLPKTILCPVDLGETGAAALRYAALMAEAWGAEVHVLHAHKRDQPFEFMSSQIDELAEEDAESRAAELERVSSFVAEHAGARVAKTALTEQDVVDAVTQTAEAAGAGIIVVGTHGRVGVARLVSGSIAEAIIARSRIPVLTVRSSQVPPDSASDLFRKVLCPINFSEVSKDALRYAALIAAESNGSLSGVYAVDEGTGETEESLKARLCESIPESAGRQCSLQPVIRFGDAAEQIVKMSVDEGVDLIVIGAQKRRFLETVLFGTTTERVVRHAECPVLVVPRA